jgi:hypothetical protein
VSKLKRMDGNYLFIFGRPGFGIWTGREQRLSHDSVQICLVEGLWL